MRGIALSLSDRRAIAAGLSHDVPLRRIASQMGRHHSVVSREVSRNGGRDRYTVQRAHERAGDRTRRPKLRKLATQRELAGMVDELLEQDWSPHQIQGRLRLDYPNNPRLQIHASTIYASRAGNRTAKTRRVTAALPRRNKSRTTAPTSPSRVSVPPRQLIPDMVMIAARPSAVATRIVPGHWEGDLLCGAGNRTAIITLVERSTRYLVLGKLNYDHSAARVAAKLASIMGRLPPDLALSLTWDQGREMTLHQEFTRATGIPVYVCDPGSPWQRGTNVNTNRLLRKYFPKGTDLDIHSQRDLDNVAGRLNGRPLRILGWETPHERFGSIHSQDIPVAH